MDRKLIPKEVHVFSVPCSFNTRRWMIYQDIVPIICSGKNTFAVNGDNSIFIECFYPHSAEVIHDQSSIRG